MTLLFKSFFACALAFVLISAQPSAGASEYGWDDLIDMSAQDFEDPYRDLTYQQIDALRSIVVTQSKLTAEGLSDSDRGELETTLSDAQALLVADDIDPDWLIDQRWVVAERRERAATAGNPEVDGQTIVLAGFALAGPPARDGTPVAYLVPERGMCSHMPPPNPNQMIRVRLNGDWSPSYIHEPVRITGTVTIAPTQENFHVVDGPVQMNATFLMEAKKVETIEDMRRQDDPEATLERARAMAKRMRASTIGRHSEARKSE